MKFAARSWRAIPALALLGALLLPLAGCGKRNVPEPPPGVTNTYPRTYPAQ